MKQNDKRKKKKALIAALAVVAVLALIGSMTLQLTRWQHYVLTAAVLAAVGFIVYHMAQGVDVSQPAPAQRPIPKTGNETVDDMVIKGQELLMKIRQEDDEIPDPELSAKIVRLEDVANRIFRTVADQPQKAPQIRRFMEYYLPTTLKMLTGYRKLDERQVTGENAEATRKQIREAMDIVLSAFDKQLDTLHQEDMLDISTDIEVLETLLRQDGLVEGGVTGQNKQ